MAAETPVIEIKTLEAVKNVKDLKDNISALKSKLDDVSTSTEEYADITKQLSQNQAALRNVMNGTNSTFEQSIKSAQGLDSSYNSLVQQLKEATQEWRTIPKYLNDVDKAQGVVNQAWTTAAGKVEQLRSELKDMDATTGNYTRNVGNYKSALDGFAGTMGQVQQIGGDMVNGISAAASSLSMLGINTEGLSNSMNNLRIAVAAVQGAKGFAGMLKQLTSYFKAGKQATAATKAQTTATQAQAAAQNAANVATTEGAAAMGLLQKALIATGIGALVVGLGMLVAHFEDIVKWVGKVGEKFGLWKIQTDQIAGSTDKLKTKIEEQNHALENEQKIRSAQGTSNITLLKQKKQLVQQQINDTKATIENVKARIAQLQADDRWWKFWQGTKGKVKKATEELEGLEEVLKNLNQIDTDIDVDIQVEGIKAGQKAADDAAKEAAKAVELAQNVVNKGVEEATKVMQSQETELQKIEREHKANVDLINSAITATEKLTGVTQEQKDLLNNGLTAEAERYAKVLSDYYGKEYEKKIAEQTEKTEKSYKAQYEIAEEYERTARDLFRLDSYRAEQLGKATVEQERTYNILKDQVDLIKNDLTASGVSITNEMKGMTQKELTDKFGEPIATALKLYFEKEEKLKDAGNEMIKTIFDGFEEAFNERLSNGDVRGAREISDYFWGSFYKDFDEKGLGIDFFKYVRDTFDKGVDEYLANSDNPDSIYLRYLFPQGDINLLKQKVNNAKKVVQESFDEIQQYKVWDYKELGLFHYDESTDEAVAAIKRYEEASIRLDELEEQLFKKRIDRFTSANAQIAKYFNTYGNATVNVMDSVADAWEAALQAQVKNGKKSEEEAKRSFENVKKLQMASAIINTGAAVVQALADPTVPSYYVKVANAAAAAIAGAAQIIKIANTEFSSSAGSATDNTPKLVDRTPQLQYTVGLNPQDYAEAQAQNPIRAYITDKDVVDGIDQYNKRKDETTF